MRVLTRYAELLCCLAFEVELNHDCGLVSHHPTIMSGLDRNRLRRSQLQYAAIGVPNMDLTLCEETNMRVLAQVSAYDRLHMLRPIEPRRVNHPLHTACTSFDNIQLYSPDGAALGALNRSYQRIRKRHASITLPRAQ